MNDDLEAAALDLLKEVALTILGMERHIFNRRSLNDALTNFTYQMNEAWKNSPEGIAKRMADEIAEKIWLADLDKKGA